MKRFHVHVHVDDLAKSVAFYSKLFAAEPARLEGDYAKWMLDDPRINFAISTRGNEKGVDHLGIQADDAAELAELKSRASAADLALFDQGEVTCCYAHSDKYWVTDPQGVAWEHFQTLASVPVYSERKREAKAGGESDASACCASADASACAPQGKPVGVAVTSSSSCC
jgi:catechol 2,3-dioxygenase-like lactoylglutathione lyase family enzyme